MTEDISIMQAILMHSGKVCSKVSCGQGRRVL